MTTPSSAIASSARRWTCPSNRRRGIARAGAASPSRCGLAGKECTEDASTIGCGLTTDEPLAIAPPPGGSSFNTFADRLMLRVAPGYWPACPFCSCWKAFHSGGWKPAARLSVHPDTGRTVACRRQFGNTSYLELTEGGRPKKALLKPLGGCKGNSGRSAGRPDTNTRGG